MSRDWRWHEGDAWVREVVEAWHDDTPAQAGGAEVVDATAHRRAIRLTGGETRLLVKHFRIETGPHALREHTKSLLGLAAWSRERRGLALFAERRLPAPRLLGVARTPLGDALLAVEWIEAPTLWQWLESRTPERRTRLLEVAAAVGSVHAAGLAHGDLHPGNLLVTEQGPVFVDLQRTRPARPGGRRQRRDLGLLDYSLGQLGVSRTDRLRVLQRALPCADPSLTRRRSQARRAVNEAERTRERQTRARARRGRSPAPGAGWRR